MKHKITNELDYLVARAELESDFAQKILKEVRAGNDYWKEKAAAKLALFCEHHEKMLRLYVELKIYYPELTQTLEEKWNYLKELHEDITHEYEKFKDNPNTF